MTYSTFDGLNTRAVLAMTLLAGAFLPACSGGQSGYLSDGGIAAGGSGPDPSGGSGNASTGGRGTGSGASTGGNSGTGGGTACTGDSCPAPRAGVTFNCEKRFLYGVNYAWRIFGYDFGSSDEGVAQHQSTISSVLQDMRSNGVDVVRWWMYPDLDAPGISFDGNGSPTGLGGTSVADLQAALQLAQQAGVHLNLTLFSFDDFSWSNNLRMKSIITNSGKRGALMNVVRQIARTVEQSGHADRVVSWDVINEPEWAISGTDPYGDPDFGVSSSLEGVSFSEMETFVSDTVKALKAESHALVTVGSSAIKWPQAWAHVGLDYYTVHCYDWTNQYFPYDKPPGDYGITDKPVVMGEFPFSGLGGDSYATMLQHLFDAGYAGAMGWAINDNCCGDWGSVKSQVNSFASSHSCVTRY